jgi:hypothetical protein
MNDVLLYYRELVFQSTLTVYVMCINVFQIFLSSRELLLLLQNITVERSPQPTFGGGDCIVITNNNYFIEKYIKIIIYIFIF